MALILAFLFLFPDDMLGQSNSKDEKRENQVVNQSCQPNQDKRYDRNDTFNKLANVLTNLLPEYNKVNGIGFLVEENQAYGFFVSDLTNPSNNSWNKEKCIEFSEGHIYHFAPILKRLSISHIAVLINGQLKIFDSINCEEKGNSIEDVESFLVDHLAKNPDKESILKRVKNYREFGIYKLTDVRYVSCG